MSTGTLDHVMRQMANGKNGAIDFLNERFNQVFELPMNLRSVTLIPCPQTDDKFKHQAIYGARCILDVLDQRDTKLAKVARPLCHRMMVHCRFVEDDLTGLWFDPEGIHVHKCPAAWIGQSELILGLAVGRHVFRHLSTPRQEIYRHNFRALVDDKIILDKTLSPEEHFAKNVAWTLCGFECRLVVDVERETAHQSGRLMYQALRAAIKAAL